jgi:probable HAF family extracellular repeat protein
VRSRAFGINDHDQVVGSSQILTGEEHATLWEGADRIDLETLGGNFSLARDINDLSQVVGFSTWTTESIVPHAFLWENGSMTDLGTLGGEESRAFGINELGQIAGYSQI